MARTTKWVRRHPAVAASIFMALLAATAAGVFAYSSHLDRLRIVRMELDHAKEQALLSAMGGNIEEAERQIEKAEESGASTAWVRVLRGQVALYRGHNDEAVRHLEQAVQLEPDKSNLTIE